MKKTAKQALLWSQFSHQHIVSSPGTNLPYQNEFFSTPSHSIDDPFGLMESENQIQKETNRYETLCIERDLKLLTSGQEKVLIENYVKNLKQGEMIKLKQTHGQPKKQINQKIGETKNIPKNFGKQLIKFVRKNREIVEKILLQANSSIRFEELNTELQKRKGKMNRIRDLRELWVEKFVFGRQMRIVSIYFMRRFGLSWIFNSRIVDFSSHIKYRRALLKLIQKPEEFINLKIST